MDSILSSLFPTWAGRKALLARLLRTVALSRSRQRLGVLDDHMLRDIGLSRGEASLEAERSCWNVPAHWLR